MKSKGNRPGNAAVLLIAAAFLFLVVMGRKMWANILPRQRIRMDAKGDGHFGSGRQGHVHQGVDLLVSEGEPVTSPLDGRIVRYSYAYDGSPDWRNIVIHGEGVEVRIMYATLAQGLHIGDPVRRGQLVGIAQGISKRYGPPMKDHLHVEGRRIVGGALLNPEHLLRLS